MNILTVDVEDWYHGILRLNKNPDSWDNMEDRIEYSTNLTLELLNEHNAKATFFVLGYVAEKHPDLLLQIKNEGHEIATHGYYHQFVMSQNPVEFYNELKKAKELIEKIIGEKILGYRAPYFTITKKTIWALEEIKKIGFKYDSSIFPTKNNIYGIPTAPRLPYYTDHNLLEFPPTCRRLFGQNVPIAGGFYFRFFPYWFIKTSFTKINKAGHPILFYFHTADIDNEQPKIKCSFFENLIHYYNLNTTKLKLKSLLGEFQFTSICNVLKNYENTKNHHYWRWSGGLGGSI